MVFREIISILGDRYAKYRIRSGRGAVYLSEIEGLKNALSMSGVLVLLINEYTGWLAPLWVIFMLWFIQKFIEYGMGWLDQKHLGWWIAENRFKTMSSDPVIVEILERVKNIESKLK